MRSLTPWLFLLPAIGLYAVVGGYPILSTLALSLTDTVGVGGTGPFVGLRNYAELARDDYFLNALRNTAIWIVAFLIFPNALGLVIALLLKETRIVAALLKTVFFLPLAVSFSVVGIVWKWIYLPEFGLLDQFLTLVGLDGLIRPWLGPDYGLAALIVASGWRQTAFAAVIFLAGLSAIPQELLEAARIDGAGRRHLFFRITLPLLRPATTIAVSSSLISALLATEIVLAMTQGGPFGTTEVVGYRMYVETFWNYRFGYGAAIGVVVTVMAAALVVPFIRRMSRVQERDWS